MVSPPVSSSVIGRRAVARSPQYREEGTLKLGDPIIAGNEFGRVRAMFDENGKPVDSAAPSIPCVFSVCRAPPNAGDDSLRWKTSARRVKWRYRQGKFRDVKLAKQPREMGDRVRADGRAKAARSRPAQDDVAGHAEHCVTRSTSSPPEVQVKTSSGVGGITISDVQLAAGLPRRGSSASTCRADSGRTRFDERHRVEVQYFASFTKPSTT